MQDVESFIAEYLGGTRVSTEEIAVDCVACGKPGHMYVNAVTGLAHCFVCGYGANMVKLIADVKGVNTKDAYREYIGILKGNDGRRARSVGDIDMDTIFNLLGENDHVETETFVSALTLPAGLLSLNHPHAVKGRKYLEARGFTPMDYVTAGLYYGTLEVGRRRGTYIIFPDYDEHGRLRYYTSRKVGGRDDRMPKTIHPKGVSHPFGVGEYLLNANAKTLMLVEGPLDMLALRGNAVALLGKVLSQEMIDWVVEKKFAKVILIFDKEVIYDTRLLDAIQLLVSRGVNMHAFTQYPKGTGDPADFVRYRRYDTGPKRHILVCQRANILDEAQRIRMTLTA